jgi:hypothetical protein
MSVFASENLLASSILRPELARNTRGTPETKTMKRPPLPRLGRRDTLSIRLFDAERLKIGAAAAMNRERLGEYVRRVALQAAQRDLTSREGTEPAA